MGGLSNLSGGPDKAAAARQRLHRERRRLGLRCFMVPVSSEAITALERAGLLEFDDLADVLAELIEESVYEFARSGCNA